MPRLQALLTPIRRLPAPMLNGLGIGVGLLLSAGLIAQLWGLGAAAIVASGFGAACVADNVCAPRAKLAAMLPAALSSFGVAVLVVWARHHPGWMAANVLLITFCALLWTAWGKRGLPQSFAMILSMVFQMAAVSQGQMDTRQALGHLGWVGTGIAMMVGWAWLSTKVLAGRYRTLALADSLDALGQLIATQALWTRTQARSDTAASHDRHLLALIRQQAGLADVFQSARDQLYSEADSQAPGIHHQIDALIEAINLRDVVLACQLDIDQITTLPGAPDALLQLARYLDWHSTHMHMLGEALRLGQPMPLANQPPALPATHPTRELQALARRALHLQEHQLALDAALQGRKPIPHPDAGQLHTFVSPTAWAWGPLRRQWHGRSPVLRHAARCTLAMGCAMATSHILPWHSHPHWLLMTVAVVMRGSLEQTLARRNARVMGTVIGCALASLLLATRPDIGLLFLVLAIAQSLAHAYALRDYRVTAASGAVMALIQAHLFAHGVQPAWQNVAERLADTLLGAGIAWGFSYVLPAWERSQLPALVSRLRQAQLAYAQHVLRWHEVHPQSPQRSHARREVYDTIWLLAQALQRTEKEPAYARRWSSQLERMLVRSHRLISQLASVRIMLTRRLSLLEPEATRSALARTEHVLALTLAAPQLSQPPQPSPATAVESPEVAYDLPSPAEDPTPWLQRRLRQIEAEAQAWAQTAEDISPRA